MVRFLYLPTTFYIFETYNATFVAFRFLCLNGIQAYLASREKDKIPLQTATVKRVEAMGMGDRVCVDLCSLLVPGEGLLVTYLYDMSS
jgi:hypothetical protein